MLYCVHQQIGTALAVCHIVDGFRSACVFEIQVSRGQSWDLIGGLTPPHFYTPAPQRGRGGILFYLCPSFQDIFHRIFLSNC